MYLGNLIGAIGTTVLIWLAGMHPVSNGAVGEAMVQMARSKFAFDPVSVLARGVLCNVPGCLAVWCAWERGV